MVLLTPKFFRRLTSFVVILLLPMAWDSSAFVLHNFGLALTFLGGVWLFQRVRHPSKIALPWVVAPMAIYVLFQFVSVTFAPMPVYSLRAALTKLAILLLFIFIVDSFEWGWDESTWLDAFHAIVALVIVLELGLAILWLLRWILLDNALWVLPPIRYTAPGVLLSNANSLSAFLNLGIPLIIAKLLREKSTYRRYLWSIFLFFIFVVSYLSASRSGWLSLVAGLVAMFGILWWYRQQKTARDILWALGFLLLGMGLAIQQLFFNGKAPLNSARGDIWRGAWMLFLESPIWGHGIKSFGPLYAQLSQLPPGFPAPYGHNIILQILVESGIIGLGVVIAGLWIAWFNLRRSTLFRPDEKEMLVKRAAFVGVIFVFGVHQLGDYILWNPLYVASGLLLMVIFLKYNRGQWFILSSRMGKLFLGIGLVAFLSMNLWAEGGDYHYWEGLNAARGEDWASAQDKICAAAEAFPQKTHFAFECALVSAQLDDTTAIENTIALQSNALQQDPYWAVHQANFAVTLWQTGAINLAREAMAKTVASAPNNSMFALNLGWMAEQSGDNALAKTGYSQALDLSPSYAHDVFFSQTALRQNIVDAADIPTDPLDEGWQALDAKDFSAAKLVFDTALKDAPQNASIWAGLALAKQGLNLPQAETDLKTAQFISPTAWQVVIASAEFAKNAGDNQNAADILFQYFEQQKDIEKNSMMYYSAPYYFGAYHQPMLSFDLAPQLVRPLLPMPVADEFRWLADFYRQNGDSSRASSIDTWLSELYQ